MKLLMLTRYGRQGASSRMRSHQYVPYLQAAGIDVTISTLFSDSYVQGLQLGQKAWSKILAAYQKRVWTLLNSQHFDLIWIEKESLPWLPAGLEHALLHIDTPYVLDYDDAVFHYYDLHRISLVRRMMANKHPVLMRKASLVVAGNNYLADFARKSGARRVELVPTVIDLERYPVPSFSYHSSDTLPCVGWIGQLATAGLLAPLARTFRRLAEEGIARFTAVGIDAPSMGLPMASIPWTEDTEVASISSFDIGIMPLADKPFDHGKCGYKLIQYMACGLPVVASPVSVNCQIVEHGVNGFLAETPEQWEEALRTLVGDSALRTRMGLAGRAKVEREYCIQITGPRLVGLIKESAKTAKMES